MEAYDTGWKAYENALLFHLESFSNFEWFKSNLENGPSPTEFVFSSYFFIVRPNAANDIVLESLKKYETFSIYCFS